jgi:Na+-translocating ferredoxin:NAD+ oxidoreductase RNF subunit RnfB
MDFNSILYPVLSISGMGLLFGIALGFAGRIFYVKEDPKIGEVREALPGANCGGCGYAGCDAFAVAVAAGEAPVGGCPVGGADVAEKVAEIMGKKVELAARKAAYVKCAGSRDKAVFRYDYVGLDDCKAVSQLAGSGSKSCGMGCLGNGSCAKTCPYNAIAMVDGIAKVNSDICVACGLCVPTCPRNLIELIPVDSAVRVACNSTDSGKVVRAHCTVGCIGCKMCEKVCAYDAIHVTNLLAKVDCDKCTLCGECVKKCPTKAIVDLKGKIVVEETKGA